MRSWYDVFDGDVVHRVPVETDVELSAAEDTTPLPTLLTSIGLSHKGVIRGDDGQDGFALARLSHGVKVITNHGKQCAIARSQ